MLLQGITLELDVSVGIAVYPEHGGDVDTLMQRANVAMYVAKKDHSGCELYAAARDDYSPGRLALASELRRALSVALIPARQTERGLRLNRTRRAPLAGRFRAPIGHAQVVGPVLAKCHVPDERGDKEEQHKGDHPVSDAED